MGCSGVCGVRRVVWCGVVEGYLNADRVSSETLFLTTGGYLNTNLSPPILQCTKNITPCNISTCKSNQLSHSLTSTRTHTVTDHSLSLHSLSHNIHTQRQTTQHAPTQYTTPLPYIIPIFSIDYSSLIAFT